jgi:HNH endonuclease
MYCVYCGEEHDPGSIQFTDEHVIPYAMGGSNALTIRTCARQNNDLGRDVDAPFLNLFTIRSKRFFLGLESTSGNPPSLDLSGVTWIDGKETPISYLIQGDEKELRISRPSIKRTATEKGEHWEVSGSPEQVRKIIEGKIRKQSAQGKTVTLSDGSILRVEDLEKIFEERLKEIQNPSVLRQINVDLLVPVRFFSKLALGICYLHFGESFGKSPAGSLLRSHMRLEKFEDARLLGAVWPMTEAVNRALEIIGAPNEHTIALMESDPPVFIANLFGDHGAIIHLTERHRSNLSGSDRGVSWRIQLPSRKLTRLSFVELVAHRADSRARK